MNTINSNVGTQQPKRNNKILRHAGNAALVAGGSALVNAGTRSFMSAFETANDAKFGASSLKYHGNKVRLHDAVSKFSEKLFPKGGKISNLLEKVAEKGYLTGGAPRMLCEYKGKLAIFAVAATAITALIARGIYKAGKINGDN